MYCVLKRIAYAKYDDFIDKSIPFLSKLSIDSFAKQFDNMLEEVVVDGKSYFIDLDVNDIKDTITSTLSSNNQNPMEEIDVALSEYLFKKLTLEASIPQNILFEKEVWAYINCFILYDVVKMRFFSKPEYLQDEGRIRRVFYSDESTIDRTGLRWLWALALATYDETYQFELTKTAREFIDPVKALYERTMGTNETVFKAYVRAIELLNSDVRIKSSKYRSVLPTHIRNLAAMKIYESNKSIEDLAKIFAEDIASFINE